jgi:hypothetical protein
VNGWVVPSGIAAFAGETTIDTNAAVATVNVVDEDTAPSVALIFAVPVPELVANPFVPVVLLITATVAGAAFQLTDEVRFCVLPSV